IGFHQFNKRQLARSADRRCDHRCSVAIATCHAAIRIAKPQMLIMLIARLQSALQCRNFQLSPYNSDCKAAIDNCVAATGIVPMSSSNSMVGYPQPSRVPWSNRERQYQGELTSNPQLSCEP